MHGAETTGPKVARPYKREIVASPIVSEVYSSRVEPIVLEFYLIDSFVELYAYHTYIIHYIILYV